MATQASHLLSKIKTKKTLWNLKVKILRVWTREWDLSGPSMKLLLCDEEGTRIQADVSGQTLRKFSWVKHFERYWFSLKGFYVMFADILGKTNRHSYQIYFMDDTEFTLLKDYPNYNHFLVFTPIIDIIRGPVTERYPIDVIGVITWVGKKERRWSDESSYKIPRMKSSVQFTIRDREFNGLECVAYGDLADFVSSSFTSANSWHIFCIIRCFRVHKFCGHTWLIAEEGISNIEAEDYSFPQLYSFMNGYPYPLPESYNNEHKIGFKPLHL